MAATLTVFLLSLFVSKTVTYTQLVNSSTIAVSSTTYGDYVASRTVDGNTDQIVSRCFHSGIKRNITEAWLRIDLGSVYSVKSVKFWYRGDRGTSFYTLRLRGYSLRVSNETSVPPLESSCYTDPGNATLPTIVEEDCERTAQYIWIYQSNKPYDKDICPILEICEVQVFGCNVGYYGEDCSKKCNHCRNNATCGIQNGECDGLGCSNNGYQPPLCQPCQNGSYGLNCSETCGNCLNDTVCHHVNGNCLEGCAAGFQPPLCIECISRKHGPNCEKQCSETCLQDVCHRRNGTCLQGCKNGYRGIFCTEKCQTGSYGMNCNKACGHCYKNTICRYDNGTCLQGCATGYKSHDCQTPCNDGEYGVNCHFNCSRNCLDGEVCNKTDGSCRSCADGYTGIKCNTKCEDGKYGKACSESCGACLDSTVCNHMTGLCELGCEPGWQNTAQCKTACNNGTYGHNCQLKCSGNCLREVCDKTDGSCISCVDGHQTDLILLIISACYAIYMLY